MWTALPWRRGRPFVCCGGCKLRVLSQSLCKRGASSLGRESLPVPEHVCSCAACSCCNKKSDQKAPSGGKHFLLPPEALCARVDDPSTRESGLTTAYESNLQITNEHPSYHRTLVCLLLVQLCPNQEALPLQPTASLAVISCISSQSSRSSSYAFSSSRVIFHARAVAGS